MPLDLNDPNTWVFNTLDSPSGPIPYWVLADLEAYHEEFVDNANLTRTLIAVPWNKRQLFRRYALGFATHISSPITYFNRVTPLPNPYQPNQFLVSLKKVRIHAGTAQAAPHTPKFHETDSLTTKGWFNLPTESNGIPPRIIYDAVFACPPYDIVDQTTFQENGYKETIRYVIREQEMRPRERKVPSFGFETDDGAATPIPEVGFIPFVDYEFTLTWCRIPLNRVPHTAIETRLLTRNNAVFDYPLDKSTTTNYRQVGGTYGRFRVGDVVFMGLASKLRPYRGPHGEWLMDLPYIFRFQPADGTGDGMIKIPRNNNTWVKVRERGSVASPKYLYVAADHEALFQPEN